MSQLTMVETAKQKIERLRDLRVRLKSGDYNGTDIMHAWIAVKEYADLLEQQAEDQRAAHNTERQESDDVRTR